MSKAVALTTVDNPFDPFDQFDEWFLFDNEKGYNSCGRLARVSNVSDEMSEEEKLAETERAIDEIIKYDFLDVFIKFVKNDIADHVEGAKDR